MRAVLILCLSLLPAGALADQPDATAGIPRAVTAARATAIPPCAVHVDAAAAEGDGTAERPYRTIAAALDAVPPGGVICVAEGDYPEQLRPAGKPVTLAGGFQSGTRFAVRDSALHVSRALGSGGSFLLIEDPAPTEDETTAIDGFEITGYSQAILRDLWYGQRIEITNNHIHDNRCEAAGLAGAGFALANVSGTIRGNVFARNVCGRGGAGFLNDTLDRNAFAITDNLFLANAGDEPDSAHGGALYLFMNQLAVTGNAFVDNEVTGWGAGLYIGAYPEGGQHTDARLAWNVYRGNRAGNSGGGLFCDDGATCASAHEIFVGNCGHNILVDSGFGGPTVASFDHMTNVGARDVGCAAPGIGLRIDKDGEAPDRYSVTNALFWDNAEDGDFAAGCAAGCDSVTVSVAYSMAQTRYVDGGVPITFGDGMVPPADPLFAGPEDLHLQSEAGRWTPAGPVRDAVTSPAIGRGAPSGAAADAGPRPELGAYGNSPEASFAP